jgi:hypothetical protein
MKYTVYILFALFFTRCTAQDTEWNRQFFRDAMGTLHVVSSELDEADPFEGPGKYGGHNIFDKDGSTAWVEGEDGAGVGEHILFTTGKSIPEQMVILNGYQKNQEIFAKNNRVKTIKISMFAGFMIPMDVTEIGQYFYLKQFPVEEVIELTDTYGPQKIAMPFTRVDLLEFAKFNQMDFIEDFADKLEQLREDCPSCPTEPVTQFFLKLEIMDVYKGSKWDDTCISDIWFTTEEATIQQIPPDEKITKVWEDPDAGIIYVNTDKQEGIVLVDRSKIEESQNLEEDEHLSITLMEVSPDREWAQVDYLYSQDGAGRVEEYSILYSVRYLTMVEDPIVGIIYGAFGFLEEDGKLFLDTSDGPLDLEKILQELLNQ